MTTRSKAKKLLLKEIIDTKARDCVRIENVANLQRWVAICQRNILVSASIEILEIDLPVDNNVLPMIRRLLTSARRFHTLRLHYATTSFRCIPSSAIFNNLTLFDTTLPHKLLVDFIDNHPRITNLILGACGTSSLCPLRGSSLMFLEQLSCPPACLSGLVAQSIWHVETTYKGRRDRDLTSHTIMEAFRMVTNLTTLHIDFNPTETDFLEHLAEAAPSLCNLKLTESLIKPRSTAGTTGPVFRDVPRWTTQLFAFPNLTTLWLKINDSLVLPADNEEALIRSWFMLHGVALHPKLSRLLVWTNSWAHKGNLSTWRRIGRHWNMVYQRIVPDDSTAKIDEQAFHH